MQVVANIELVLALHLICPSKLGIILIIRGGPVTCSLLTTDITVKVTITASREEQELTRATTLDDGPSPCLVILYSDHVTGGKEFLKLLLGRNTPAHTPIYSVTGRTLNVDAIVAFHLIYGKIIATVIVLPGTDMA